MDIPPTPYNYGIWYEYVRQTSPQLNRLVDSTIGRLGSLPSFVSKELFHQFLVAEEARYNPEHKDRLEQLVQALSSNTNHLQKNLADLNQVVHKSQRVLRRADREEHLETVLSYLDKGTQKARQEAVQFAKSLDEVQSEITQLRAELEAIRSNVDLDPMTQLLNYKGLERQLYDALLSAEDDLSLLILDIDNLKDLNTQHGKRAGTALITHLGHILSKRSTENTSIARIEGGTFAILLHEATLDNAIEYAEDLRLHLNKQRLKSRNGEGIIEQIKVSIGVATVIGEETPTELIARANGYLDNAKRQGRNRTASR
ncbi:GGDEF domain-containing protein [Marinomonas ostreistagni]|uniref:GGDEF domain-containing protein n=1 Tax=Marinomonas ostreistagni TaxID=359209 RepID=UPI00194F8AF0|nr:GGDEF domain-containing protein [Marinomonas ostreistagni]MBM6550013.1 diguanylate cyclase [Marinomonas ostreistagni]